MAQESQSTASILDFLYVDLDRIKSWLAQLHDDGILTSHKKVQSITDATSDEIGGAGAVDASANVLVANAKVKTNIQGKMGESESYTATHEKSFDAAWTLPLNFLDLASEFNLIQDDVTASPIGALVKVSGRPEIRDIKFLQDIWGPAISHLMGEIKLTHKNKAEINAKKSELTGVGDILAVMPPNPQMVVCSEADVVIWSSLVNEHMRVSSSTLALTHGVSIEGEWSVIGILDAVPDQQDKPARPEALRGHELFDAMNMIVGAIREVAGRPATAYGITPLVIYRKVDVR